MVIIMPLTCGGEHSAMYSGMVVEEIPENHFRLSSVTQKFVHFLDNDIQKPLITLS